MDHDLLCVINRADLDAKAEQILPRFVKPLKEEVHRVEVVGGATRIPRVKEAAKEFFGRETLDGSLNGDEAAAFGATLYAAKQSTSFRLREFTITDAYPHAIGIRMGTEEAAEEAEGEDKESEEKEGKSKSK